MNDISLLFWVFLKIKIISIIFNQDIMIVDNYLIKQIVIVCHILIFITFTYLFY